MEWYVRNGRYILYMPFGIELQVFDWYGKYAWNIGNELDWIKDGECKTMERAKSNAIRAYKKYVEKEMEKYTLLCID